MDVQLAIVILLFLAAIYFVGKKIYFTVFPKNNSCNTGCNKCSANFDNISSSIKK